MKRINQAKFRFQRPVSDPDFRLHRNVVEDCDSGGLGTGSGGGCDANERSHLAQNRQRSTNGRIDKVEQFGLGILGVEVGDLGRVHHRTTSNRQIRVKLTYTWIANENPPSRKENPRKKPDMYRRYSSDITFLLVLLSTNYSREFNGGFH